MYKSLFFMCQEAKLSMKEGQHMIVQKISKKSFKEGLLGQAQILQRTAAHFEISVGMSRWLSTEN